MSYLQILLEAEGGEQFVDICGREGIMEFTDMNKKLQPSRRPHTKTIVRAQEAERLVECIEEYLTEYAVEFDGEVTETTLNFRRGIDNTDRVVQDIFDDVLESYEALNSQVDVERRLRKQQTQNRDLKNVIRDLDYFLANEGKAEAILRDSDSDDDSILGDIPLIQVTYRDHVQHPSTFKYMAGVIPRLRAWLFKRQVFLSTRGNSYVLLGDSIHDPYRLGDEDRETFIVFFLGERLKKRLEQVIEAMDGVTLVVSENVDEVRQDVQRSDEEDQYLQQTLERTHEHLQSLMFGVRNKLVNWKARLIQEKAVCVVLNKFKEKAKRTLKIEGWVVSKDIDIIQESLDKTCNDLGLANPVMREITNPPPPIPSAFPTNRFTKGFLALINTYGVPRYREYNPAVPSMITFPFLFGVMYGDLLHGTIVFLVGVVLVANETRWGKKKLVEPLNYLYHGRYIILLMGMFAMYCGLIYNDCMSMTLTLWPSGYDGETNTWKEPYQFGVDPAWWNSKNQLMFLNSYKMKMAVIFGVTQMTWGLFFKFKNHLEEGDKLSIYWEFIPQLLFLWSYFGYMCFIIVYKWCINWGLKDRTPPSLITILVDVVLNVGEVKSDTQLFSSIGLQKFIHIIIFLTLFFSVPIMLFMKPYMKWRLLTRSHQYEPVLSNMDTSEDEQYQSPREADIRELPLRRASFNWEDELIPQLIHTIEFVLGTVSNTASYLRLWALSLAHAELSSVFYTKCLRDPMQKDVEYLFIGSVLFLAATTMVLLVMDSLECFLHTLRLHWVEFMNKFFHGDGVKFRPFYYITLLDDD